MADKGFGVRKFNLIGASGTPTITSPNNINLNAVNVAISTDVSIGGTCTATEFSGALSGWVIGNDTTDHYTFQGPGLNGTVNDPDLNLVRGQKYIFHNRSSGHPFRIQATPNGSAGTAYNVGVTNNDGSAPTDIIFDVPHDAPNVLFYQCTAHSNMGGRLIIGQEFSASSQTSSYNLDASDIGTLIDASAAVTVVQNTFKVGDAITIYNSSTSNITITQGTSVTMYLVGTATTGDRTLAQKGVATVLCVASNTFVISGGGLT
tara:strand:+ start:7075 stop:7860 length:786 start_codon:yes stop_codon:yes gene_type:complete